MRSIVAILALLLSVVTAQPARGEEQAAATATPGGPKPVYATTGRLNRRHIESVLMSPRGALTGADQGTNWLLRSGTGRRDTCDSPDATSGLRMLCVGW